jgi:hypothetical protein
MKQIIAYALLISGVPSYAGLLIVGLLSTPIVRIFPDPLKDRLVIPFFIQSFNGLASIFSALLLFRLFGLAVGNFVLIISAMWTSLYFFYYRRFQLIRWFSWLAGIMIGWVIFKGI